MATGPLEISSHGFWYGRTLWPALVIELHSRVPVATGWPVCVTPARKMIRGYLMTKLARVDGLGLGDGDGDGNGNGVRLGSGFGFGFGLRVMLR